MFESSKLVFLNFIFLTISVQKCASEPAQLSHLSLHSPDEPEYTEVLVKRVGDNLTLTCELKGDRMLRQFVWVIVGANGSATHRPFSVDAMGPSASSTLLKTDMQLEDSGQYMCSSPPFSVTKFILVQNPGIIKCARGAFSCGARCVLASYVCDGRADCAAGEDEAPPACPAGLCQRPDMLNCSSGRCVPAAACCAPAAPLCLQPSCCLEHAPYARAGEGYIDVEYPALYEDRHTPDDYGFIQSTIYTVTACALIFMIAAVLLVSAICKMHMKRAALRSYARAAAARHYAAHQVPRFPPCYEASTLLEQQALRSPPEVAMQTTPDPQPEEGTLENPNGYGLSRLGAIFSSRYRQVPTECDVEMTAVRSASLAGSPARTRTRLDNYRSPTYCDLNDEYFISSEAGDCGRELNYARPLELCGSRLTLQLGRFQLSLPRRGAPPAPAAPAAPAPAAPAAPRSSDTYTLNGRTIRLLGGNFENYPRPPPYEVRKLPAPGPPPEYVSAGAPRGDVAGDAEPPPRYEELDGERVARASVALDAIRESGESLDSIAPRVDLNGNGAE